MTRSAHTKHDFGFEFHAHGRCGEICCSDGENIVEVGWEMSGSPHYDILLAPLDLRRWASGADIPRDIQHRILAELRAWLVGEKIRSDAASPRLTERSSDACRKAGCSDNAVSGSVYCAFHYDETLLR